MPALLLPWLGQYALIVTLSLRALLLYLLYTRYCRYIGVTVVTQGLQGCRLLLPKLSQQALRCHPLAWNNGLQPRLSVTHTLQSLCTRYKNARAFPFPLPPPLQFVQKSLVLAFQLVELLVRRRSLLQTRHGLHIHVIVDMHGLNVVI